MWTGRRPPASVRGRPVEEAGKAMSHALYRLGRSAASRPLIVIGIWILAAVVVIGASGTVGRELEDTFEVPGLDSQEAIDLLSEAESDQAGLTAQVVLTPLDDAGTFFDSADTAAHRSNSSRFRQSLARAAQRARRPRDPASAPWLPGPKPLSAIGSISADGSDRAHPSCSTRCIEELDKSVISRTSRSGVKRHGHWCRPSRSRWAATCSSRSRSPRPASAR